MRGGSPPLDITTTARSGGSLFVRRYLAAVPSYYRAPDAPEPNVPRKIGVTAIIERNGDVLVERRADSAVIEWAFIGGSLDDDSVLDALHREVLEETGFEVEQASLLGIFSDPSRIVAYADGNVVLATAVIRRDDELDAVTWNTIKAFLEALHQAGRRAWDDSTARRHAEEAVPILLSMRDLERTGDHAVNIARRVVYIVTGEESRI